MDGLEGPVAFNADFRIRLVGSDHPEFALRGIVTGSVYDTEGSPVVRATIHFEPQEEVSVEVPDARSNREGIFVRTLIPPGKWTVVVTADGFETYRSSMLTVGPGSHHIEHAILERDGKGP